MTAEWWSVQPGRAAKYSAQIDPKTPGGFDAADQLVGDGFGAIIPAIQYCLHLHGVQTFAVSTLSLSADAGKPDFRRRYYRRIANGCFPFSKVCRERRLPVCATGRYGTKPLPGIVNSSHSTLLHRSFLRCCSLMTAIGGEAAPQKSASDVGSVAEPAIDHEQVIRRFWARNTQ